MKYAIPLEDEESRRAKSKRNQEKIVKEVPLKGSIGTEKAPRVVRLVEDEDYYRLMIGEKLVMRSGRYPPRYITICKEELAALKELFAAI